MRHGKKGKKFHRTASHRKPFLRNLANDLIRVGKIETTEARAKAVRPMVERLVTLAKKQTLASRRVIISRVHSPSIADKLVRELAPKYESRKGGYTRVVKSGKSRKRDGAPTAKVEFVSTE